MATPNTAMVGKLVAIAAKLSERHEQADRFAALLDPMRKGSMEPVAGEIEIEAEIQAKLAALRQRLPALPATPTDEDLNGIEAELNDSVWDVLELLRPELEGKWKRQEAVRTIVEPGASDLETRLAAWEDTMNGIRFGGAPFAALHNGFKAAKSKVAAVRDALTTKIYGNLQKLHDDALTQVKSFEDSMRDSTARVERIVELMKQADLLIMQAGEKRGQIEYRVLLRPADRETRGINIIQDVVKISRQNRAWMLGKLNELTDAANQGYRDAHARKVDPGSAPRTITPAGASSANTQQITGDLGRFMSRVFLPERVREYLLREKWSFSITTNELELPWELMFLEHTGAASDAGINGHLCVKHSISRMPLGQVFPPALGGERRSDDKWRMLLVYSDPKKNLPEAGAEIDQIQQAFKDRPDLEIKRLDPDDATNANVNGILVGQPFDFIHYAGHAYFNKKSPGESGLLLKDTILTADNIRRLNRGGSLIFLNACDSGTVANSSQPQQVSYLLHNPEPVVGLASAFVYTGALGCVGSMWPVYDKPARELAVLFYKSVLEGEPTGEALRRAREDVRKDYPEEITWAAYVLYGDPTFRLARGQRR